MDLVFAVKLTAEIVRTNRVSPPDIINLKIEELVGDQPFDHLKSIAGFSVEELFHAQHRVWAYTAREID